MRPLLSCNSTATKPHTVGPQSPRLSPAGAEHIGAPILGQCRPVWRRLTCRVNLRRRRLLRPEPTVPDPSTPSSPPRRRGFLANVLIVSGGSILGQAIALLSAPIVARLFAPEAFGIGAIYGTILAVIGLAACLRYDNAVLLPKDPADGAAVLATAILAAFGVSALCAVATLFAAEPLLHALGADALIPYSWLLPVGVLLTALNAPLSLYFQRSERFATVTMVRLMASVGGVIVTIAVGWLGYQGGVDLVMARTGSLLLFVPLLFVLWVAWKPATVGWKRPSLARMRAVAWRYREFPLVNTWAALLNTTALQAPPLVLAALFSPAVVGLYAMADRLIGLPIQFLSTSVAQVFFQRAAAEHARGDKAAFAATVQQVALRLTAIGVLPVLGIALLGPPLVTLIFGERWADAGIYAALIAPVTFAMFFSSPLTVLMSVLEMHRFNVAIQGTMLLLRAGALWGGLRLTGTPEGALACYGAIVPIGLLVQQTVILKRSGASPGQFFAHLGRHLAYAIPCAGAFLITQVWLQLPYAVVAPATVVGALPYIWLALREDPELVAVGRQILRKVTQRGREPS